MQAGAAVGIESISRTSTCRGDTRWPRTPAASGRPPASLMAECTVSGLHDVGSGAPQSSAALSWLMNSRVVMRAAYARMRPNPKRLAAEYGSSSGSAGANRCRTPWNGRARRRVRSAPSPTPSRRASRTANSSPRPLICSERMTISPESHCANARPELSTAESSRLSRICGCGRNGDRRMCDRTADFRVFIRRFVAPGGAWQLLRCGRSTEIRRFGSICRTWVVGRQHKCGKSTDSVRTGSISRT